VSELLPTTPDTKPQTHLAMSVGGFEESFDQYGFIETTLIAKLIAAGCMVVPVLGSTAVHVEFRPAHLPQSQRNVRFRDAHRRSSANSWPGLHEPPAHPRRR
jgi:hypothetical protein